MFDKEQIIKAMECCTKAETWGDCEELGCPALTKHGCYFYLRTDDDSENAIYVELLKSALSLIRELTEENERLRAENAGLEAGARYGAKHLKAYTVRRMQERLKEQMQNLARNEYGGVYYFLVSGAFIDRIAEELLEEKQ